MTGRLLTVEGGEGAGKSSNLPLIERCLKAHRQSVVCTREPGGTPLSEHLRALLLGLDYAAMSDDTELLLMFAARAEHLAKVIRPALAAGQWVLCDRFTDATYAYQGSGRGIEAGRIATLERWTQGELRPDLTVLLDVPAQVGMQRIGQRIGRDRIERQRLAFFEAVNASYRARARAEPQRFLVVDASQPLAQVQRDLIQGLRQRLADWS